MRFRGKSIRRKIVALLLVPLVSLTALWALATTLTGSDAKRLLDVGYVMGKVGGPVEDTIHAVQDERRQTLIFLADPRAPDALVTLQKRRADTDKFAARVKAHATPDLRSDLDSVTDQQLTSVISGLDGLAATRRSVENSKISRTGALDFYSRIVDPGFTFLATLHGLQEVDADNWGRALIGLARAREMLSREDALVTSALMTGSISGQEIRRVSDLVASRVLLYSTNLSDLPSRDRAILEQYWRTPSTLTLGSTEDSLIAAGAGASPRVINAAGWQKLTVPVLDDLDLESDRADSLYSAHIDPLRRGTYFRAGLASVLGFLALLVSVIVSVRVSRDLIRDLSQLRKEAHEVSGVRLPSVMRRLAAGEQVDVETEAPRLDYEKDEVGQVGQALNTLQRAAVEAAVKQADLRRGVSEVFVNLARRNQVLLHRQLTLLDTMERRTEDTEELADLFRLDHLTTRMRRHAEGLVILSGAAPSRQWRKPVQLMDVVRAAVAEVEDYERIEVRRLPRIGVGGPAVADLTHLIAELLENATVFSPPHTAVQVHGERVANGFTLEIHDRGLGMAPEMLLDANLRLAETPEFELSDTDRLGLFVVSRLAQRQNVRVSLQPSPYGGTTAVVFLPVALLTDAPETEGVGFRLDRKTAGERGRGRAESGSTGRLTALAQIPTGLGSGPSVLDGPVELEAPMGPLGRDSRPIRGGGDGIAGLDEPDGERGGIFRAREHLRDLDLDLDLAGRDTGEPWPLREDTRLTHDEVRTSRDGVRSARDEAREARDRRDGRPAPEPRDLREPYEPLTGPASGRSDDPLSLPRRRPPTLVADRGRRVDETGRTRAESPAAHVEPPSGGPLSGVPAPLKGRASAARSDAGAAAGGGAGTDEGPDLLGGLPRRVRQANLAPQLRDSAPERVPGQTPADRQDGERDADEVRNRMASLQRGWQRGRRQNDAEETTGPGETDRTTSEGDGR
ncbi:sensor histidine kinase [Streptomyces liangshanensis]|uniref:histidine kinase n=1 Tax=Streptomyces liangshanensis TaxID=2717324 RepID=A0A6G9H6A6_9ACTN|nr:nitrate- and nitrite sensing domain-containing protein [Streptomyces liangshanensis]QIQ05836.1 sensor histidine kinase [Streptomyces liangshanensis]